MLMRKLADSMLKSAHRQRKEIALDVARTRREIITAVIYTVIILITMWDWAFYIFLGIIEVVLTALIVWYAWNWPRQEAT